MTIIMMTPQIETNSIENAGAIEEERDLLQKSALKSSASLIDSCGVTVTEDDQTLTSRDDVSEEDESDEEDENEYECYYTTQQNDSIATTLQDALNIATSRCRKLEEVEVHASASEEFLMARASTSSQVQSSLLHLAAMYRDRGEYERSVEYFQQAMDMIKKGSSNKSSMAKILVNIGRVRMRQEQLQSALECFMKAWDFFQAEEEDRVDEGNTDIYNGGSRYCNLTLRLCKRVSLDLSKANVTTIE